MVQYTVIWRRTGLKDKDFDKERNIEKLQCTVIWDQERELIKKIYYVRKNTPKEEYETYWRRKKGLRKSMNNWKIKGQIKENI